MKSKFTALLFALFAVWAAEATVYYFDPENGSDTGNNGLSEDKPFKSLSKKNGNSATDGDEFRLLKGTYKEELWINKNNITIRGWKASRDEVIIDGENSRVGFHSDVKNTGTADNTCIYGLTVRNAFRAGSAGTTFAWGAGIRLTGANCIVSNCVVENCRITNREGAGLGFGQSGHQIVDCVISNCATTCYGAGLYFSSAGSGCRSVLKNVEVVDCVATNATTYHGGGIYTAQGLLLDRCEIKGCISDGRGGGLYIATSCPTDCILSNSTFEANVAKRGGGIYVDSKSTNRLFNCVFQNNEAKNDGANSLGGGYCSYGGCSELVECTFEGNSSWSMGGGAYVMPDKCSKCVFKHNKTAASGGGLAYNGTEPPTGQLEVWLSDCVFVGNMCTNEVSAGFGGASCDELKNGFAAYRNCLFADNVVSNGAGGACCCIRDSYVCSRYENCTFVNNGVVKSENSKVSGGGALAVYNSCYSTVTNCIFWGNWAPAGVTTYVQINSQFWSGDSFNRFQYCLEQNKTGKLLKDGTSNCIVSDDIKFLDAANGDYRLQRKSPAVDKGINHSWMAGWPDLYGKKTQTRIYNGTVDIGCYEYWPHSGLVILFK